MFFKRVLLALKGMVAGGDAAEICSRNGMQSFVEELRPTGVRLQRLFAHNVKASDFGLVQAVIIFSCVLGVD